MTNRARASAIDLVIALALAVMLVGCGGGVAQTTQSQGSAAPAAATPGATTAVAAGGGGGANRGFDCAVVITPTELDLISGFKAGTVSTTSRGDQNPDTPGYGECAFEEPKADSWIGSIGISSGDSLEGFQVQYDFIKAHDGQDLPGLGVPAIVVHNDAGLNMLAKSSDGVGINVGLAWVTNETTEDRARAALQKILQTVLSRV